MARRHLLLVPVLLTLLLVWRLGGTVSGSSGGSSKFGSWVLFTPGSGDITPECAPAAFTGRFSIEEAVRRVVRGPFHVDRDHPVPPAVPHPSHNLTCYSSPLSEYYRPTSSKPLPPSCPLASHVSYPKPAASKGFSIPAGIADMTSAKVAQCTAAKHALEAQLWALRKRRQAAGSGAFRGGSRGGEAEPRPGEGGVESVNTELGLELAAHVPYVHYLAGASSELKQTLSVVDSTPVYSFWSPLHCEFPQDVQRQPSGLGGSNPWPHHGGQYALVNRLIGPESFPQKHYERPAWHGVYCGWGLADWLGRRFAVIFNKRKTEEFAGVWPLNTISYPTLAALYDELKEHYIVVYQRPTNGFFPSEPAEFHTDDSDYDFLQAHAAKAGGKLVFMQDLLLEVQRAAAAQGTTLTLNEIQFSVLADADAFISVQGGPSYLASLWGPHKTTVLVERRSPELALRSVAWFPLISGTPTHTTLTERDLLRRVRELLVWPLLPPVARQREWASLPGLAHAVHRRLHARLRELCIGKQLRDAHLARYELCFFRSAAQVVMHTEESYDIGWWNGTWIGGPQHEAAGAVETSSGPLSLWPPPAASGRPDGLLLAHGSDVRLQLPWGMQYSPGEACEGLGLGGVRMARVIFNCTAFPSPAERAERAAALDKQRKEQPWLTRGEGVLSGGSPGGSSGPALAAAGGSPLGNAFSPAGAAGAAAVGELLAPILVSVSEPFMCRYELVVALPPDLCTYTALD